MPIILIIASRTEVPATEKNGAGDGIRTHDFNLGKVALYPWATPAKMTVPYTIAKAEAG